MPSAGQDGDSPALDAPAEKVSHRPGSSPASVNAPAASTDPAASTGLATPETPEENRNAASENGGAAAGEPPADSSTKSLNNESPDPGAHPHRPAVCLSSLLWVLFFLALTLAARCANYRNIFVTSPDGKMREIYFVDGDCYSRMTRVKEVLQHWGLVHYHAWENFPTGTWPHTTAPMDYLIAAIALVLKPFMPDYVDMAGAIVSPILGVLITAFLALWARELNQQYRKMMLLVASLSPILVHGTCLGRPDHQSLQMLLIVIGIGAELIMARAPNVKWGIVSGVAWGLGLWVSLYEPLVLMVALYVTKLIFYRPNLFVKERVPGIVVFFVVLGVAYALDGPYLVRSFQLEARDQVLREYFARWSGTISEMSTTSVFSELLWRWVGFGLLAAPLLLIARLRDTKRSTLLLALLVITFIFTLQEVRWGYFFALIYAMSLPWQLSLFKRKWLVYLVFLLSLWPMARDWDERIFPDERHDFQREARVNDQRRLRQVALWIGEHAPGGILAPWWWSPALAYWSGQPAVAGSSHESLSGIVDTSRFFLTTDPKVAEAICTDRNVETIVTGNPEGIVNESAQILGQPLPDKPVTMADILWLRPHSAPYFLHLAMDNNVYHVFEVNHGRLVK